MGTGFLVFDGVGVLVSQVLDASGEPAREVVNTARIPNDFIELEVEQGQELAARWNSRGRALRQPSGTLLAELRLRGADIVVELRGMVSAMAARGVLCDTVRGTLRDAQPRAWRAPTTASFVINMFGGGAARVGARLGGPRTGLLRNVCVRA